MDTSNTGLQTKTFDQQFWLIYHLWLIFYKYVHNQRALLISPCCFRSSKIIVQEFLGVTVGKPCVALVVRPACGHFQFPLKKCKKILTRRPLKRQNKKEGWLLTNEALTIESVQNWLMQLADFHPILSYTHTENYMPKLAAAVLHTHWKLRSAIN